MSIMRRSHLLLLIAVVLAGCAGGPSRVDRAPQDEAVSPDRPDLSAAIQAIEEDNLLVAESLLRGLTQTHPQAAMPWVNIGLVNFRRGEWVMAEKAARRALELDPRHPGGDYLLGLLSHQQGEVRQAEKHYLDALKKAPQHAHSHYNLALLYDTYFQDIEAAVKHYRQYLALISVEDKATEAWLSELEGQLQ